MILLISFIFWLSYDITRFHASYLFM